MLLEGTGLWEETVDGAGNLPAGAWRAVSVPHPLHHVALFIHQVATMKPAN